jgi:hypothetical protein
LYFRLDRSDIEKARVEELLQRTRLRAKKSAARSAARAKEKK